ncbi:hypothetical protein P6P90_02970 [Ectobacillus antri]|jgi:hypothetical protein|uniref:Group-specific protein n=1 Tax=Ectobacillus antri TaxID=2486280 RepID=A0ABT6H3H8_9BACI|nr:hypothetical protein [Ectobacillus antri]MDG4656286.1 hypothetical protein [Ectobacillus antri]MDG5752961.1 hypothetical protein [Ectobacillus antri]
MFDPTVFDNLKVIAEGAIYDKDLDGDICVINRSDCVDLATMSRAYHISFCLPTDTIQAKLLLTVDAKNLVGEILEQQAMPGCRLEVTFTCVLSSVAVCENIQAVVEKIWGQERMIVQRISYQYKQPVYTNEISVAFQKQITEDHADDLSIVVEYMITTLHMLKDIIGK